MKLSIFTPTHDSSFLLEIYKRLESQTDTEWEWVIVYNNNAIPIQIDDHRIKSFFIDNNDHIGFLKSFACEKATGDILLELDHDDLLTPTAVEDAKNAFKEDPEIGFVYSNTIFSTGDFKKPNRFDERFGWKYREVNFENNILDEYIHFDPTPNVVSKIWFAPNHLRAFKKSFYNQVGGHDKEMRVLDDQDLMCKLYKVCKFKHINKGLYVYRIHGNNSWLKYNQEIQNNVMRIYELHIEELAEVWSDRNNLRKIELGGRFSAKKDYETVDLKDADIKIDLNNIWPFEDNSVGVIRANDIFEHLKNPIHTMKELYRVLAPNGFAFIQVPSTDGRGAFSDPTHVSYWNEVSFSYYTNVNKNKYIDCPVRFQSINLYTTEKNYEGVCWTKAHLVKLVDNMRVAGEVNI